MKPYWHIPLKDGHMTMACLTGKGRGKNTKYRIQKYRIQCNIAFRTVRSRWPAPRCRHPTSTDGAQSSPPRRKGSHQKKSRIRETLNLSTDADHRTDIFLLGGDGKKEKSSQSRDSASPVCGIFYVLDSTTALIFLWELWDSEKTGKIEWLFC